jgi:4-amino-4-deoxy-L-arabinose transferase-like glycosyltransferase
LEIATVWNVILTCASLYIFYLILKKYFKKESIALGGVFLLLTSFQFFLHIPTYMREIPVIFSLLLFIYLILNKKSYWLAGLSLLLIFDAKEYVAVMILPGIFFYILWKEKGTTFWESVKRYISSFIKLFLPTLVLLLLMIFTRVVPVNMYALSLVPGVTKGGIQYQLKHLIQRYQLLTV